MNILKEFKEFAMKGNVVDLAIGIIIGSAFGKIVSSMVSDILMPPVGMLIGGVNFTDLKFSIKDAVPAEVDIAGNIIAQAMPAVTINYGNFIQVIFDFTIVAFAIFLMIKAINSSKKKEQPAAVVPPPLSPGESLLTEIRDLLKSK
jgi:large conductance mechanosensitive channel